MTMQSNLGNLLATVCFGLACAIGLVGAFVGLETNSFWVDELFTAWIVQPGDGTSSLVSRIGTELNAPLYFVFLFLYSQLAGTSDAALRSFSAVSACAAVLIFVSATRPSFSLSARLFGGAMATGSLFWFFHSQNTRHYAFCMMISAILLALCLALLIECRQRDARAKRLLAASIAVMFVASFVHFYLMYESVAVLLLLALFRRRDRVLLLVVAGLLAVAVGLYVKLVVTPHTQITPGNYWLRSNFGWYVFMLKNSVAYAFGLGGSVAMVVCIMALAVRRAFPTLPGRREEAVQASGGPPALGQFPLDPVTIMLIGVPTLMVMAGIASSILVAPSFSDRYLLVCAPFLWGLAARLYDSARINAPRFVEAAMNIALSAVVLWMATVVVERLLPKRALKTWSEPFRQSAEWIRAIPECRGQILPVISQDPKAWYKPGYAQAVYESAYGRYLHGFATPRLVLMEDILAGTVPADLIAELRRRVDGGGCPVLAWTAHNVSAEDFAVARTALLKSAERSAADTAVRTATFRDGHEGFVAYVDRGGRQR